MRWLGLLACIALAACVYGSSGVSNTGGVDELVVETWASASCVNPGDTVTVRASVTNQGSKTRTIELPNHPALDLCVASGYGAPSYPKCYSDGKALTPDLTRLELKPGERKSLEMKWVGEAGSFGAVAILVDEFHKPESPYTVDVPIYGKPYCPGH